MVPQIVTHLENRNNSVLVLSKRACGPSVAGGKQQTSRKTSLNTVIPWIYRDAVNTFTVATHPMHRSTQHDAVLSRE